MRSHLKDAAQKKFGILVLGERNLHETVRRCLPAEEEIDATYCLEENQAQARIAQQACDLIVASFDLPQFKPIRFLSDVFGLGEAREVVMVGEAPSIENVVRCMQLGARDFLQLPRENPKLQELIKKTHAQWQKKQNGAEFQAQQHERF